MTVSNIMAGFRKTGIFPFDPTVAKPKPQPTKSVDTNATASKSQTRKERRDVRAIKVLLEGKEAAFQEAKKRKADDDDTDTSTQAAKKRKTFVPPFGTAITEQSFRDKILERENEKSEKTKSAKVNLEKKTDKPSTDASKNPSKAKKKKFQTPYSQPKENTQEDINNSAVSNQRWKGKSKGSAKGKGKAKATRKPVKRPSLVNEDNSDLDEEDDGVCIVCGKIQPDGLNLNLAIKFVNWAQCDICKGWVHLKYCTSVEDCGEEPFSCDNCREI